MKHLILCCIALTLCISLTGCMDKFLDIFPEDKISSANFPQDESEIKLLLNGVYSQL